jgi:hypothetical protein
VTNDLRNILYCAAQNLSKNEMFLQFLRARIRELIMMLPGCAIICNASTLMHFAINWHGGFLILVRC